MIIGIVKDHDMGKHFDFYIGASANSVYRATNTIESFIRPDGEISELLLEELILSYELFARMQKDTQ